MAAYFHLFDILHDALDALRIFYLEVHLQPATLVEVLEQVLKFAIHHRLRALPGYIMSIPLLSSEHSRIFEQQIQYDFLR